MNKNAPSCIICNGKDGKQMCTEMVSFFPTYVYNNNNPIYSNNNSITPFEFPDMIPMYVGVGLPTHNTTKQFSHTNRVSENSTQFWGYLPGDHTRSPG